MGGSNREGTHDTPMRSHNVRLTPRSTGGKAKPLKAAKKQNKDLDEDDLAYLEKKRAGTNLRVAIVIDS